MIAPLLLSAGWPQLLQPSWQLRGPKQAAYTAPMSDVKTKISLSPASCPAHLSWAKKRDAWSNPHEMPGNVIPQL